MAGRRRAASLTAGRIPAESSKSNRGWEKSQSRLLFAPSREKGAKRPQERTMPVAMTSKGVVASRHRNHRDFQKRSHAVHGRLRREPKQQHSKIVKADLLFLERSCCAPEVLPVYPIREVAGTGWFLPPKALVVTLAGPKLNEKKKIRCIKAPNLVHSPGLPLPKTRSAHSTPVPESPSAGEPQAQPGYSDGSAESSLSH